MFVGSTPNKLPIEAVELDLTAQGAAISATTLFTPSVSGMYRINVYAKVTRAATTSSTMGAITVTYTDADDSVAQSKVLGLYNQLGVTATTNTNNSTASSLMGIAIINAKAGVAVTYAVAYISSGTTSMQYSIHLKVEAM